MHAKPATYFIDANHPGAVYIAPSPAAIEAQCNRGAMARATDAPVDWIGAGYNLCLVDDGGIETPRHDKVRGALRFASDCIRNGWASLALYTLARAWLLLEWRGIEIVDLINQVRVRLDPEHDPRVGESIAKGLESVARRHIAYADAPLAKCAGPDCDRCRHL